MQDVNGVKMTVQLYQLKNAIKQKKINIVNLTLTFDNRLMDSNVKKKHKQDNKLNIQDVAKDIVGIIPFGNCIAWRK